MTFISYAQNFEDVMLWRALRHIQNGCYIDIGANDPIVDSISLAFYEHGWRGVHLEPTAQYANLLRQQRPDELVIQAAVSDSQKLLTFFEFPDTGLSTLDATIAAEHQQKGFRVLQTVTPTLTLDDVFAQNLRTDIHWLKIDVEGFEEAVLRGWNTSEVRPWIVVVESTLPMSTTPSHQHWEALVLQKGYQFVYFDGLNRYYVSDLHPELMAEPWIPPNVFDGFTIDGRASNVFSQDIQRRLQAATQSGQQSAVAELQASEQAKQTLLNQLAETRGQLEQQAASAREEHQLLSRQLKDARDELGQMVRLVSQREQEFAKRFKHFQADYQAVSQLLQQERDQAAAQLQTLQQQLQTQQQQYQAELQRHRELEDKLSSLQQQLREKEQAFASQLLQLYQQKNGQQKVFQIREQSLRTELQRAREEIQRVGDQYQAELQDLRQTNETLNAETARYQQQYLELQHEFKLQLEQVTAELQQQIDAAQIVADEKAEALTALQLDAERQQAIAAEQFNQLQQQSAEECQRLQQQSTEEYQRLQQESAGKLAQLEAIQQQSASNYQVQHQQTVERYESELQQTKELQLTLEQQIQNAEDQHAAELHQVLAELNSARHFIEQHQQHIAELSTEREQLRHELSRVARGYVALRADSKEKASRASTFINALKEQQQAKLQQVTDMYQKVQHQLANELGGAKSEIFFLNSQFNESQEALASLSGDLSRFKQNSQNEIDSLTASLNVATEKISMLSALREQENIDADRRYQEINFSLEDVSEKLSILNTEFNSLEITAATADLLNETLLADIENLKNENNTLLEQLTQEKERHSEETKILKEYISFFYKNVLGLMSCFNELSLLKKILRVFGFGNFPIDNRCHEYYFNTNVRYEAGYDCITENGAMNNNHLERSQTLNEVYSYSGAYFVFNAFITLLNRIPDPEGHKIYTEQMILGVSKDEIIYQIVKSQEWNIKKITVPGLKEVVKKVKIGKVPLIGWVIASIMGWPTYSHRAKQLRTIEAQLAALNELIDARFEKCDDKISVLTAKVSNQNITLNSILAHLNNEADVVNDLTTEVVNAPDNNEFLDNISARSKAIFNFMLNGKSTGATV